MIISGGRVCGGGQARPFAEVPDLKGGRVNPRAGSSPAFSRATGVLAFMLLIAMARPALGSGQAVPDPMRRVSATGALLLKAGQLAEKDRVHLGGWAGVVLSPGWAVGGGGFALLDNVELAGTGGGTGFVLDFGYGGIFFRYWEPLMNELDAEVGLLLGAGHAEVQDRLTRREIGSSNFMVGEAELGLSYPLVGHIRLGASVGYRLTAGVDDLPRVTNEELNSFTGTLSLRIGGR